MENFLQLHDSETACKRCLTDRPPAATVILFTASLNCGSLHTSTVSKDSSCDLACVFCKKEQKLRNIEVKNPRISESRLFNRPDKPLK